MRNLRRGVLVSLFFLSCSSVTAQVSVDCTVTQDVGYISGMPMTFSDYGGQ